MVTSFLYVIIIFTRGICQNCLFKANNSEYILNLTEFRGTIITSSDTLFDYAYSPCNMDVYCDDSGFMFGWYFSDTHNTQNPIKRGYNPYNIPSNIEFIGDSINNKWKLTFSKSSSCLSGFPCIIVYWICDMNIFDYKVIDSSLIGFTSNNVYSYHIQYRISSQYACINEFKLQFDLKIFLNKLNLNEYYELFANQGFNDNDYELISKLNDDLLQKLGIKKMAHRMKILSYF